MRMALDEAHALTTYSNFVNDSETSERQKALSVLLRCLLGCKAQDVLGETAACASRFPDTFETAWQEVVVARCAQDIESAVWIHTLSRFPIFRSGGLSGCPELWRTYKAKIRSLAAALRRSENTGLKQRVLDGELAGAQLVNLDCEAFLSEMRLEERQKHREEALLSVWVRHDLQLFDERLICPTCSKMGSRYAVLREPWAQSGQWSATTRKDLGRHVLAECDACGERWQEGGV